MSCCVAAKYDGWCDDVELLVEHEGKSYCIFHAPVECEEKLEKWDNELVFARIEGVRGTDRKLIFKGAIFPHVISFDHYDEENPFPLVSFRSVTFAQSAYFSDTVFSRRAEFMHAVFEEDANFDDADFTKNVDFEGAKFCCDVSFYKTTFTKNAYFENTTFSARTTFNDAVFSEDAYFSVTKFSGRTNFSGAEFLGVTDFQGSEFLKNANADFRKTTFSERTNFNSATFSEESQFGEAVFCADLSIVKATFLERVNFNGARFAGNSIFKSTRFAHASFNFANFEQPALFVCSVFFSGSFRGCHVNNRLEFDRTDLRGLSLLGAPIESFRFISCDWPKSDGRNITCDARKVDGQGYFEIVHKDDEEGGECAEPVPKPNHLEDLFRRLKKGAKNENDEMMASDWHYSEKEMQRIRLGKRSFLGVLLYLYKLSSGYGERPRRALLWLLLLVVMPAMAEPPLNLPLFPEGAVYYLPLVKAKAPLANFNILIYLWMIFWQVLISVQAALFGFALRNKFRR